MEDFCFFQKRSPYLADVNYLIQLQYQLGDSLENKVSRTYPNMTKCQKWNDVKKSHMSQDPNVVITFEDVSGLLLILVVGLIAAIIIMSLELLLSGNQ